MRNRLLTAALLLVLPGVAQAQQTQPPASAPVTEKTPASTDSGAPAFAPKARIDFGFRASDISGDPARFQRFRDERQGAYIPRFDFKQETETTFLRFEANNVGYRDQRYAARFENIGKLKLNFEWDQIPLYISSDVRTLYSDKGNGVLSIDQGLRQAIQNAGLSNSAAAFAALSNGINSLANPLDLRSRRDTGRFNLTYSLNRDVDFKLNIRNTSRTGHNLMSFGFGTSPGLNPSVEVPIPTDDRTTDVGAMLEFANTRGLFSAGFTASKYNNNLPFVQFDNPLRAADAIGGNNVGGPAFGRSPLWPSNDAFAFNVNGSYKLPARSRASAFISIGRWNQNAALIAPTSNTALVAPPLERPNAEAKADIKSMVYTFTSRPNENLWLNAKYRYYDYASKTEPFEIQALPGDWNTTTATWENEPPSIKRNTVDVDASYTPNRYVAFGAGITREDADRTVRYFEKTAENSYRVTADSTGNQYVTVRGKFEHSRRTGSGFDEEHLTGEGEHAEARQFDIADRNRDRGTVILTVTPVAQFENVHGEPRPRQGAAQDGHPSELRPERRQGDLRVQPHAGHDDSERHHLRSKQQVRRDPRRAAAPAEEQAGRHPRRLHALRPAEPGAGRGLLVRVVPGRRLRAQHLDDRRHCSGERFQRPVREHDLQRIPLSQLHGTHRVPAHVVSLVVRLRSWHE